MQAASGSGGCAWARLMSVRVMSIRDYYLRDFQGDLAIMFRGMDARDVRYTFGNDWMRGCSLLPRVPETRRPQLLVCLYFTVLVDQAVHTHFWQFHRRFEGLTMYPKFLVGFGHEAHLNPVLIFQIPIQRGLVTESAIRSIIPAGMRLFIDETNDFFRHHMHEITTREFFGKLLADPDVSGRAADPLGQFISTELRKAVSDVDTDAS